MELEKKQIHMNRYKGNVTTQITLDDDFIVPDTLDDMAQVMLDTGEIQIESIKNQEGKVGVKGKLDFRILYRRESGGLQTLGGNIPFEETINVPELEERDFTGLSWVLEDLNTEIINSRKLGVQAIITLQVRVETLQDAEAAVEVDMGDGAALGEPGEPEGEAHVETLNRTLNTISVAVRRKDTYRLKEELTLTGGKPNIGQLLWQELKLRNAGVKPLDGKLHLEGELNVFVIYQAEDENMPVQWLDETIPFSGELDLNESREEMIPMVSLRLAHRDLEAKPDYDGELRELDIDAVLELDIKLYQEEELQLLSDLYSNSREIELTRDQICFDRLLTKNICKTRLSEKLELPQGERILQICHSAGAIKLDEVEIQEDSLEIDGVVELSLLYLTSDDQMPVQAASEQLPFHCTAEARGITRDSVYQLNPSLEQLTAVMLGGDLVEVKMTVSLDILILQPVCEPVITQATVKPMDLQKLQQLPGIVGYIVQPEDSLWEIARKFHTTVATILSTNELPGEQIKEGMRLLLIKEIDRE